MPRERLLFLSGWTMRIVSSLGVALLSSSGASAAIGETERKCNDRYGERWAEDADFYNSQNRKCFYRDASGAHQVIVVIDRNDAAVSVDYMIKHADFNAAKLGQLLEINGTRWVKQKPKLGSAMNADKTEHWTSAEGRDASISDNGKEFQIVVTTPERVAEINAVVSRIQKK